MAAMGVAPELAESAIRASLGWNSEARDVDAFLDAWSAIARGVATQETYAPAAAPSRARSGVEMRVGE
jgi:cysteine sulfinate desulfinase/cysteine desulfurase-like protein